MKRLGLVLGITLGVLSQPAFAEVQVVRGIEIARACAGDIRHLCADVRPGAGRIRECIHAKLALASVTCRNALAGAAAVGAAAEPTDAHFDAVAASAQGPAGGEVAGVAASAQGPAGGEAAGAAVSAEGPGGTVVKEGAAVVKP